MKRFILFFEIAGEIILSAFLCSTGELEAVVKFYNLLEKRGYNPYKGTVKTIII